MHNVIAERLRLRGELMLTAARSLAADLRARGAIEIILFGSLAGGPHACGPMSDVDMAVVMSGVGEERMHRRLSELPEVVQFPFPLDLFVYTPEEWEGALSTAFIAREVLAGGYHWMSSEREAGLWFAQALADLETARDNARSHPDAACFMAQQAAEKALKALELAATCRVKRAFDGTRSQGGTRIATEKQGGAIPRHADRYLPSCLLLEEGRG